MALRRSVRACTCSCSLVQDCFLVQIVDVIHPGRPNVSKKELKEKIAAMYKVNDGLAVVLFGFKTKFGGGRSTGIIAKLFCCVLSALH